MNRDKERGAAAVEFAILLPVLLLLLLGIMEFGRAYNAQIALTNAAREGARVMAISNVRLDAEKTAQEAASTLAISETNPAFDFDFTDRGGATYTSCASQRQVTLTISYDLDTLTGIAGPFTLTGKGTMLCGG
ncbi:TadE/TadG family type IV pilus assembly protein [uncultured Arthrobacter sp.]|uniref:TadE/TadG family type IV pilus assembly protein n=1 Tax=uncultured Arthrobacter sp. TaxID=114050 RepID=UPI00260FF4F4|nr:TadE/TadG family type IV pilus assembly protein [uncultured Arthrobacter sp.]